MKIDLEKLSIVERARLNKAMNQAGIDIASLNVHRTRTPEYINRCIALRAKFEAMAIEEGVTLQGIFTASAKKLKHNGG